MASLSSFASNLGVEVFCDVGLAGCGEAWKNDRQEKNTITMNSMCAMCGSIIKESVCPNCGFDNSLNYGLYATLAMIPADIWSESRMSDSPKVEAALEEINKKLDAISSSIEKCNAASYGKCNETISYILDKNGHLTLTGEGFIKPCDIPWENGRIYDTLIREVVIGSGIKNICKAMFRSSKLEIIWLPSSVEIIEDRAFDRCDQLRRVYIPKDSHLSQIGENAFRQCSRLIEIHLPDSLEYIDQWAFSESGIHEILLPLMPDYDHMR